MNHNLRIRIAGSDVRASELAREEFGKTKLPEIGLRAGASYAPHNDRIGYDPALTDGGEISGQLEIEQQLYDAGIKNLKLSQVQLDVDKAGLQRRIAERDLRYDVTLAFINAVQARASLKLRQEGVDQLSRYQILATELGHSGQVGATDLLRARVELSNAVISRNQAASAARIAELALVDLVGLPGPEISLEDTLESVGLTLDSTLTSPADSLSNLDLSLARTAIERNAAELEITRRELLPTISFLGTAGILSSVDNLSLPPDERIAPLGFAAGVTFNMPLFTWGASGIREQESEIAVQSLRDQLALANRAYALQLSSTRLELDESQSRLAAIDSSLQSADEAYRLTLAKYAGGGALSLELISAQQLLAETKMNRLDALADIQRARARLEQLRTH